MTRHEGWKWFLFGLLAAGLSLATTGCGDDEEEEAGGTTVVTNIVNGTTVVVTNNPPAGNNPPVGNNPLANPTQGLVAPQLVSPPNGTVYEEVIPAGESLSVNFEWTAVPGAADYVIDLIGGERGTTTGTQGRIELSPGTYQWRVWARDDAGDGPVSSTFTVEVKSKPWGEVIRR